MLYASSFLFVVADTLTVCFALNKLVMLSAFSVLFLCSSSIITINFIPLFCACSILSYKLLFSSSLNAVFPFLVTFSQFIKAVSCSSNPVVNTSFNVFVVLFFAAFFFPLYDIFLSGNQCVFSQMCSFLAVAFRFCCYIYLYFYLNAFAFLSSYQFKFLKI